MQKVRIVGLGLGLGLALGGCHHSAATVWPKSAGTVAVPDWKEDGGQSIEPHSSVATDIEQSEASSSPVAAAAPADGAGSKSVAPAPPAGTADVIFLDDITIDMTTP